MKKHLTLGARMLCAAMFLFFGTNSRASHIVGADLYYTHVSGSTYKITFVAYGDCGPASAAAFSTLPFSAPTVCIYDGSTYVATDTLAIDTPTAGVELTHFCPLDSSQCVSPTSVIPGVKKFVYSANFIVPHTSANWRFVYEGNNSPGSASGRAAAITNLSSPAATIMQLIDTLNNSTSDNSNPLLTVAQQIYFCEGEHNDYTPDPVDPDGDSLVISLIDATNGVAGTVCSTPGGAVGYVSGFSGANPLNVTPDSFSLNSSTGEIIFHPVAQRSVIVYNIREFRGGTLVGTSQREMTVLAVTCTSCAPITTATKAVAGKLPVDIFPNPANSELNITLNNNSYNAYAIANAMGQVMLQHGLNGNKTLVNVSALPIGIYYITLSGDDGSMVRKFVKE